MLNRSAMWIWMALCISACPSGGGVVGDAGARCVGTPPACDTCGEIEGCFGHGTCEGEPDPCNTLGPASCDAQSGCGWLPSETRCIGTAATCDTRSSMRACDAQFGCAWFRTCTGTPTPCALMTNGSCMLQPGCSLEF